MTRELQLLPVRHALFLDLQLVELLLVRHAFVLGLQLVQGEHQEVAEDDLFSDETCKVVRITTRC